jgi:hypothetical protein
MAAITTSGASRIRKKHAKAKRSNEASTPAAKATRMLPFLQGGGSRYGFMAAKSIAATVFVFGTVCALIYTAAQPRNAAQKIVEKQKPIASQKAAIADKSNIEPKAASTRLGSALVSKVDVDIRDAPRRDAKVLDRAVYGSYVEVIGQDRKWAHVHATGQNVTGWVNKASLNF